MSDFKGKPTSDDWIRSLYHSGKNTTEINDPENSTSETVDQTILAYANQEAKKIRSRQNKFIINPWTYPKLIFATAASALFGILIIMQLPNNELLPATSPDMLTEQVKSKETIAAIPLRSTATEKKTENHLSLPKTLDLEHNELNRLDLAKPSLTQSFASNDRYSDIAVAPTAISEASNPRARKSRQDIERADFTTLEELSPSVSQGSSPCTEWEGRFTDGKENQIVVKCDTATALKFYFKNNHPAACAETFVYTKKNKQASAVNLYKQDKPPLEIRIQDSQTITILSCISGSWHTRP
ncbi:MAG: hypothetical protein KUG75_07965 [Pseudomonadales bacterium]|nr:hypothetical protein [Pseudomonadales bacterium]